MGKQVGGLVAVLISGGVLSVASLIGFITLFGVAVRNGLLLVDNFNRRPLTFPTGSRPRPRGISTGTWRHARTKAKCLAWLRPVRGQVSLW